jgi:hypothetical protein
MQAQASGQVSVSRPVRARTRVQPPVFHVCVDACV